MIYIGTSGFSYEDWKGAFYPEDIDKKSMLEYYSQRFQAVEINSTYYTIPSRATFVSLARRTPQDFKFSVKAHKDMTHAETHSADIFKAFQDVLEPLIESGKLGCILAQFPWSFKRTVQNEDRLQEFRDALRTLPTVVEFRNSEWANDETFELLRDLDLGYCCVDEPALRGLMPGIAVSTSNIAYVRFHGRNAKTWWKHEEAWQRYDYLYTEEELSEWVPKVETLAEETETLYLFFNNHYKGKSATNARMFAQMLGLELPKPPVSG